MNKYHSHCITNDLIKIAKIDPKLASIMCEEAADERISHMPLHAIISRVGSRSAAQLEMKEAANGFQDNSTNSKEKGNLGVPDKKYPVSSYGDDMKSCLSGLKSLGVDDDRALEECQTQCGGKGNRAGGRKAYETVKTSKTINVHSAANNNDWIAFGQNARSKSEIEQDDIPAWALLEGSYAHGYTPNLPTNTRSSNRVKSARKMGDDMLYQYTIARQISHPDDVNRVEPNTQLEEMLHKKGELLSTYEEIHRLKQAAKKSVQEEFEKPAWAVCLGY